MDKLEKYVRDEIYAMHQKMDANSEDMEYFMKRLNESLEYIDKWRDETSRYALNNQCSGFISNEETVTAIVELRDKVMHLQRGVATEEKIRKSNITTIETRLHDLEHHQRSMFNFHLLLSVSS